MTGALAQIQDVGTFQTDPLLCARAYYDAIRYRDWAAAYDLNSTARKFRLSYPSWCQIWQNNRQLAVMYSKLEAQNRDRAMVSLVVWSRDVAADGRILEGEYRVKVYLVREAGLWWVDETSARWLRP
jgi:hypothetical protein